MENFEILQSNKTGLNSKESFIVTRNGISFLRILGEEPEWEIMTATASEDYGRIHVCEDQLRLVETALRLGNILGTDPTVESDWKGREYVKICVLNQEPNQDDEALNSELKNFIGNFFEIYDEYQPIRNRVENDMLELYAAISIDEEGGDVYLSDGVWLSSDGELHDRGR